MPIRDRPENAMQSVHRQDAFREHTVAIPLASVFAVFETGCSASAREELYAKHLQSAKERERRQPLKKRQHRRTALGSPAASCRDAS
jgi:hypothetical protein